VLQEKDAPRLAILDRRLPSLNAIEICQRLRARHDPFYTYVLLLMPNSYRVDELIALEAGADECLAKPFSREQFCAKLAIAERILDIDRRLSAINHHWRLMLDSLPFGLAAVDEKGVLKRMNTTFATQMGYSDVRSLIGQSLAQVLSRKVDLKGLLDQIRWSEPFNAVEVQCRATIGKVCSVRLWGRPLPPNDEAVYEIVVQPSF
jgi:PAS domain S-box-containing protein